MQVLVVVFKNVVELQIQELLTKLKDFIQPVQLLAPESVQLLQPNAHAIIVLEPLLK